MKPVVMVSDAGLKESVRAEFESSLEHHELIKVRLHDPEDKKAAAAELAAASGAALCGLVGHTVILYRAHPEEPVIRLPKR